MLVRAVATAWSFDLFSNKLEDAILYFFPTGLIAFNVDSDLKFDELSTRGTLPDKVRRLFGFFGDFTSISLLVITLLMADVFRKLTILSLPTIFEKSAIPLVVNFCTD